jgi:hypothetical protein
MARKKTEGRAGPEGELTDAPGVVRMRFCLNGTCRDYEFPADRLDELLERADKRFGIVEDRAKWARVKKRWLT